MRKLLSVFLGIIILASCLSINITADSEDDFAFATTLGFIDGESFLPDDIITRIQLAEIYYNIIFPKKSDDVVLCNDTDFPDVSADKKHYAATVYGMGVMKGYSESVFAPDDAVTYNQLVKTIVTFLGYNLQAERVGGYPSGYLTQASLLKLLPAGNVTGDSKATFGAVASMLKRAIGVDFATLDGDGTQLILNGTDYLYYYRNVKVLKGCVTGNYLTSINGSNKTNYFSVYVGDEYMQVADTAHGIQSLLGHDVYAYYEQAGSSKTILYYEEGVNNVVNINADQIVSAGNDKISFYSDDILTEVYYSADVDVIYNGSYLGSYFISDLNPFSANETDGNIKLIDTNLDSIYDKLVITAYETYVVRDVNNGKIYGYYEISDEIKDKVIDISNYKERNIDIRNVLGDPLLPEAIKEDYVISVCRDKDANIKEIIVSRDKTTGMLQEIERSGEKITKVKIKDVLFDVSPNVNIIDSGNILRTGSFVKVYFNCEDKVAYIDVDSALAEGYLAGYLVDCAKVGGLSSCVKALIFTASGEMKEYLVSENVNINNYRKNAEDFITENGYEGSRPKRQAVLYKTDEADEKITNVLFADTPANTAEITDGFYLFPNRENEVYSQVLSTFGSYFALSENLVTFAVPNEDERDDYDEYKVGATISDNLSLSKVKAYGTEKSGIEAEILVVSSGDAGKTLEYNAPIFVITKISTTINEKDQEMIKLEGHYVEGTEYANSSFIIKKETLIQGCNGKMPELGDILRTGNFTETGECGYAVRIFEYSTKKFYASPLSGTSNPTDPNIKGGHRMVYGSVYEKSGNMVKINVHGSDRQEVHNLTGGYYKIIECKKDRDGNFTIANLASPSCVIDEKFHPGEGSEIFIYSRSGTGIAIFVFN